MTCKNSVHVGGCAYACVAVYVCACACACKTTMQDGSYISDRTPAGLVEPSCIVVFFGCAVRKHGRDCHITKGMRGGRKEIKVSIRNSERASDTVTHTDAITNGNTRNTTPSTHAYPHVSLQVPVRQLTLKTVGISLPHISFSNQPKNNASNTRGER